jgi:hypothetical protein
MLSLHVQQNRSSMWTINDLPAHHLRDALIERATDESRRPPKKRRRLPGAITLVDGTLWPC